MTDVSGTISVPIVGSVTPVIFNYLARLMVREDSISYNAVHRVLAISSVLESKYFAENFK
jgi:hypothetical protein